MSKTKLNKSKLLIALQKYISNCLMNVLQNAVAMLARAIVTMIKLILLPNPIKEPNTTVNFGRYY